MGIFFSKGIVSCSIIEKEVKPRECWSIVSNKRWNNISLTQIGEKTWSSNNSLKTEFKYCCVDYCTSVTNVALEVGTIITEDGIIGQSATIQAMPTLSLRTGYVIHGGGTAVWQVPSRGQIPCPFTTKGIYKATISSGRQPPRWSSSRRGGPVVNELAY